MLSATCGCSRYRVGRGVSEEAKDPLGGRQSCNGPLVFLHYYYYYVHMRAYSRDSLPFLLLLPSVAVPPSPRNTLWYRRRRKGASSGASHVPPQKRGMRFRMGCVVQMCPEIDAVQQLALSFSVCSARTHVVRFLTHQTDVCGRVAIWQSPMFEAM